MKNLTRALLLSSLASLLFAASCSVATPRTKAASTDQVAELLLAALDSEALYTVAGGIKPVSSGFWQKSFEVAKPQQAAPEIEKVRAQLRQLSNLGAADGHGAGPCWWGVLPFAKAHEGKRRLHAYVVHRASLARVLERRADFFAPHGLTPSSEAAEVLAIVERLPRTERFRGYGLLFGYPDEAVEFFIRADNERDQHESGVAPREFRRIPTFKSGGRFVYAVPKGSKPTAEERALMQRCADVLARYKAQRARFVSGARDSRRLLRGTQRPLR